MREAAIPALLIVDVQQDFLRRPGLTPSPDEIVGRCATLLEAFRSAELPVAHVRTLVRPDGSDAMPHTLRNGIPACIEGSEGAQTPTTLAERRGEFVARKQFYSGFDDAALDGWLRDRGTTRVVVVGLYTHACVRETALDAYERGYEVVIAADAVGGDDPSHAESTLRWLTGRAATVCSSVEVADTLPAAGSASNPAAAVVVAVHAAVEAQASWASRTPAERCLVLRRWAELLQGRRDELIDAVVADVGKPITDVRAEFTRAVGHISSAVALTDAVDSQEVGIGVVARRRPVGVVAVILPWNNPIALATGKIAPALALGNAVVVKPAPEAARTTDLLLAALADAAAPTGLVGRIDGGAEAGAALVRADGIDAVTVTGSVRTGRAIARECARLGRPLQAELGGNNAAVVLADADLEADVPILVRNAFAFAGQRCTAIRRFVVVRDVLPEFIERATAAVALLRVASPNDEAADLGPVVSIAARDRVAGVVDRAIVGGASLLARGSVPVDGDGAFVAPTLLLAHDRRAEVVQEETFGPVAVVVPADDEADAISAANSVEQGLVAAVCTTDPGAATRVLDAAQAGIVQWGPHAVPVHPEAPFGGWKASGFGPPEHGRWDADFLTRPQARYAPVDDR